MGEGVPDRKCSGHMGPRRGSPELWFWLIWQIMALLLLFLAQGEGHSCEQSI